ncbi:MAG: tryptophan--tRNA ligase, partial [Candidatus Nanopelagicales bacterium]
MSKSLPAGCVALLDPPKQISKKIKSAVTDSETEIRFDPANKPGVSNLLSIQSAFTGESVAELEVHYHGLMYGHLKVEVAEVVADFAVGYQQRTQELLDDPAELESLMRDGADRARAIASVTLKDVYDKVGFVPLV